MTKYYKSEWNAKTWRICREIFESSFRVKESLLRGYFDADGYPYYNKARQQVLVQVNSVNNRGLLDTKGLLLSLNYHPGLYRRYKTKDVWELTIHRNAEVIRFHDEIGFSIGRKQSRLETILERRQLIR